MVIKAVDAPTQFFCRACLEEKAIVSQSSDLRLCNDCFKYLSEEANQVKNISRWWVPRPSIQPTKERVRKNKSINATIKRLEKRADTSQRRVVVADKNPHQTDSPSVIKPVTLKNPRNPTKRVNVTARNAIQRAVVVDNILKLSGEGKSTREIAKLVNRSHMTVARVVAGQRGLL